ncbi:hypothetical protein [Comamonas sp. C11]|nr:hypothetical protein [Comamonas sp. C11]UUC92279.1 hypothetical protein NOX35_18600 [Comamonas sp. C11]
MSFVNESLGRHKGVNSGGDSLREMGLGEPCRIDHPAEGRSAVIGGDGGF